MCYHINFRGGTGIKDAQILHYGSNKVSPREAVASIKCGAFGFSFNLKVSGTFERPGDPSEPYKVWKLLPSKSGTSSYLSLIQV